MSKFTVILETPTGTDRAEIFEAEYMKATEADGQWAQFVEFKTSDHKLVKAFPANRVLAIHAEGV